MTYTELIHKLNVALNERKMVFDLTGEDYELGAIRAYENFIKFLTEGGFK